MDKHRRSLFALVGVAMCLPALAACTGTYGYVPYGPHVSPALGHMESDHAIVDLIYATDRKRSGIVTPSLYYGAERSRELRIGHCEVSIPSDHGRGRLEQPLIVGFEAPARHVHLTHVHSPLRREVLAREIRHRVALSPRREVFVYIHGFANYFADAARRGAQVAHDVDLDGVMFIYSWPTQGHLLSYVVDGLNAEWTAHYLVEFLEFLADESGAERIHLLAHSMGARVLSLAISDFSRRRPADATRVFDQIVLAAADIDAELFARDYLPHYLASCSRLTIYSSQADRAILGSEFLHIYTRLGQLPPGGAFDALDVVSSRIERVDATTVDREFLGHSYFGNSPFVLEDISRVLQGETPEQRGLEFVDRNVWALGPLSASTDRSVSRDAQPVGE